MTKCLLAVTLLALCLLHAPEAWGEDEPPRTSKTLTRVLEALDAEATPELVTAIVAANDDAKGVAAELAASGEAVEQIAAKLLACQEAIAKRDGDAAIALADWVLDLVAARRKEAAKDPATRRASWQAHLARGRIGVAREKDVQAGHWTTAADHLFACHKKAGPCEARTRDWALALAILEEGAGGENAPLTSLADHAGRVAGRILKTKPAEEELRRAIAASYLWQSEIFHETSRRATQAALGGYFEAFEPIAHAERASDEDELAWNRVVTQARVAKLDLKADYISSRHLGASGMLEFHLPKTGHWRGGRGRFSQVFEDRSLSRDVDFESYAWNQVYGAKGSARDVGGDNVKGVAGRSFDAKIEALTNGRRPVKIKKKRKPSRKRFNKTLPAGIEYTIEYVDHRGNLQRIRCFFVKSVKAERTLQISIYEAADLDGSDPEWQDVIESFDVTKKKR